MQLFKTERTKEQIKSAQNDAKFYDEKEAKSNMNKIIVLMTILLFGLLLLISVQFVSADGSNVYIIQNDSVPHVDGKNFYYVVYDGDTFASMSSELMENGIWIIDEITLSGQTSHEVNLFDEWYYSLTLVTVENLPNVDSAYNVEFVQTPNYTIFLPMIIK